MQRLATFEESKTQFHEPSSPPSIPSSTTAPPKSHPFPSPTPSPPRDSLLRYQPPVPLPSSGPAGDATGKKKQEGVTKPLQSLADVLNAILPPREIEGVGGKKIQYVSTEPSSREEVIALQRQLDEKLQERQARESGICPVREELYSQCFDELIRQVCISSPERGLLLLRLRDELRMSISSYQSLYAASITFGQRKGLQAEMGREELTERLDALEEERKEAQKLVAQQKAVYEAMEKRINEQRAAEEKKQAEEKEFLKYQAQHLEAFIKSAQQ